MRLLFGSITHGIALAIGFALGVYLLPIITAPPSPDSAALQEQAVNASFTTEFKRDLRGSDFLHWGEGKLSISPTKIVHEGALAPGPDYRVYLTPSFVEHEDEFNPIKAQAVEVGSVKTFSGFILDLPTGTDISKYDSVVIWCESFGEFITAAKYR